MRAVRLTTTEAGRRLRVSIRELLDEAFCGGFTEEDWEHTLGGIHVVARGGGAVLAHAAVVERTLEVDGRPVRAGYVEGVATVPSRRGEGLGSRVMTAVSGVLRRKFEMGALSTGHHAFYQRLGWSRWRGPTFVRHGSDVVATPEDDDAVMVLLFGGSRHVDVAASITCPARSGDHW